MKEQRDYLEAGEWDILVVLDACRADYFAQVCMPCETVRSLFCHTPGWVHRVGPIFQRMFPLYYVSANPVVAREVSRRGYELEIVRVWENHWGWFGPNRTIPSVHPMSVTAMAIEENCRHVPMVVHYLQPHCPYIGAVPLAVGRMGQGTTPFGKACNKAITRPGPTVKGGALHWNQVRAAYRSNLELVWQAVQNLRMSLRGRMMVTADHGEMLGEDDLYGHEGQFQGHDEVWHVPWVELPDPQETTTTKDKLEALGYA